MTLEQAFEAASNLSLIVGDFVYLVSDNAGFELAVGGKELAGRESSIVETFCFGDIWDF
jgi:hypothetical protein